MIWLSSEYLLFQMPSGESVAFSSDAIAVEIVDEVDSNLDKEVVQQAATAVYHYFKKELGRNVVTVAEFAAAMEKALDGFEVSIVSKRESILPTCVVESDLGDLAGQAGDLLELTFFPRLRHELRSRLLESPRIVRFHGLRRCVKRIAGAKRWSPRCRHLEDQIVAYVRGCLSAEASASDCTLVVD